jgi:diguanylate cyclase (GGDEF)-like protein
MLELAGRLIDIVSEPTEIDGQEIQVGASVGIAIGAGGRVTVDSLLRDADAALYRAKEQGRGRAMLFGQPA